MPRFADVLLPVPLPGLFTYALPDHLQSQAQAGCRVTVPFGKKKTTTALIIRLHDQAPANMEVKTVIAMADSTPVILPSQLRFWQWIADYYLCTLGEVYKAAVPAQLKKGKKPMTDQAGQKGAKAELTESVSMFASDTEENAAGTLSPAQQTAMDGIHAAWDSHEVCLLHGVTSSGKTELYIHLIQEAIGKGQQVLYLLPEIVLTTQLTERLRVVFGERMGVYHSKYSDAQRIEIWQRQLSAAPYDIIVGVRSSVFLPFQRLGLVIVDEEHETSFKQQDPAPRYHARNAAIVLARQSQAKVLLGTATPSLESYYNARMGKYGLVTLTERFGHVQLPEVEIVDIRELRRKRLMQGPFSPPLLAQMRSALAGGEQVILFQNRRGFAQQLECHVCGWVPRCPHCDVSLTLHKRIGRMTCHYCGYTTDIPSTCPACESNELRQMGFGTERIEDDIRAVFPEARIARMDLDTTRTRTSYERIIDDFSEGRTDILVGTQMVAKGLDFERVSVVGILSADTMLNLPDFRAHERAFQMMAQVAGRAGRRHHQGRVILQTRSADLPLIGHVVQTDYEAMYREQMEERRAFAYPPFIRLAYLYMKHRSATTVDILARDAALRLRQLFGTRVLGPDEPPVARIQSLFIRRLLLKFETTLPLPKVWQMLTQVRSDLLAEDAYSSAHIYFDIDPL